MIVDQHICTNCGACYNSCNLGAIVVESSGLFYSPTINADKCIDCGLCEKVCPLNENTLNHKPLVAYGACNRDIEVLRKSSSGGLFYTFSKWIIDQGGIVYGAVFDDDFRSVKICGTDEAPLSKMLKSKYVESTVGNSFAEIKQHLSSGRIVLFSGTPCQVAGLKSYLGREYSNLYTCDFACGGLPSHQLYVEYISEMESKFGAKVESIDFRSKRSGWSSHYHIEIGFKNGKRYSVPASLDPYLSSFLRGHLSVRDACTNCHFNKEHCSDIVLGDFWKYRSISNRWKKSYDGLSLILCNSTKGNSLFQSVSDQLVFEELSLTDATYDLRERRFQPERLERRQKFLDCSAEHGLTAAADKFTLPSAKLKFKIRLNAAYRRFLFLCYCFFKGDHN